MSDTNTGGPAFPIPLQLGEVWQEMNPCDGMTMRDYVAAKAMQAYWNDPSVVADRDTAAAWAYDMADAMLKARAK